MKIPTFKPSKRFLGEYDIPCLAAKLKNSQLPGVAARHIKRFRTNPTCEIYLRTKDGKSPYQWEKEQLEALLGKENLAVCINAAIKEYEKDPDAYFDANDADKAEIQKSGIAAYMTIDRIVIDGKKLEVIICAQTEVDSNLAEHGISIFLKKGRWRFDEADYYIRYCEPFDIEKEKAEEAATKDKDTWDDLFPKAKPGTPLLKDPTILFGKWKVNAKATKKVRVKLGGKPDVIARELEMGGSGLGMEFKAGAIIDSRAGRIIIENSVVRSEQRGNRITVWVQRNFGKPEPRTFCFEEEQLTDQAGFVYERIS